MDPLYALPSLLPSGFTSDFRFYDYYHINCSYPALSLVFYSTSLPLLSYYNMSNPCLIICYISTCSVCLYSQHDFLDMFMIRIYRYTCVYLCTPLGIRITTHWGVLTPPDPHVQVSELAACGFSQLLT